MRATLDGFHRSRVERYRLGPTSPEGYYRDSFAYEALRSEFLEPLGPGGSGRYRTRVFDLVADAPVSESPATAPVDGVLRHPLRRRLPSPSRAQQVLGLPHVDRSASRRGAPPAVLRDEDLFGSPDEALRRYRNRYVPGQRLYLAEVDPAAIADVVLDNTDVASPALRASSPL